MLLKDSYKVRSCIHSIQAIEVMQENEGTGSYSVLLFNEPTNERFKRKGM